MMPFTIQRRLDTGFQTSPFIKTRIDSNAIPPDVLSVASIKYIQIPSISLTISTRSTSHLVIFGGRAPSSRKAITIASSGDKGTELVSFQIGRFSLLSSEGV